MYYNLRIFLRNFFVLGGAVTAVYGGIICFPEKVQAFTDLPVFATSTASIFSPVFPSFQVSNTLGSNLAGCIIEGYFSTDEAHHKVRNNNYNDFNSGGGGTNSFVSTASSHYPFAIWQAVQFTSAPHAGFYSMYSSVAGGSCANVISANQYRSVFYWDGSDIIESTDFASRFISFDPWGKNQSATSSVSFSFYVNSFDWNSKYVYDGYLSYLGATSSTIVVRPFGRPSAVSGLNYFSTSTGLLKNGHYQWYAYFCSISGVWVFTSCDDSTTVSTTTDFWIGTSTDQVDNAQVDIQNKLDALFSSTTYNISQSCNILNGFSVSDCLLGVFYPGRDVFSDDLFLLREIPPWGYVFRFYDILTNEASSSLPVIDAYVPSVLPGGGSHVRLDANRVLDPFLNATTGVFLDSSASSTDTFFTITNFYWSLVVYLGLGLYIVRRFFKLSI